MHCTTTDHQGGEALVDRERGAVAFTALGPRERSAVACAGSVWILIGLLAVIVFVCARGAASAASGAVAMVAPFAAEACSRAVYFGEEGQTVTGRTMDWFVTDMDTNMWLYPRGLERTSNTANPLVWTSKYGSVVTTIYEGASADGMNEAGLVAKEPNPLDARGSVVSLTDDGRDVLAANREVWAATVIERLRAHNRTQEELATAVAVLRDLLESGPVDGAETGTRPERT